MRLRLGFRRRLGLRLGLMLRFVLRLKFSRLFKLLGLRFFRLGLRLGLRRRLGFRLGPRLRFMFRLGFSRLSNLLCLRFLRLRLDNSILSKFLLRVVVGAWFVRGRGVQLERGAPLRHWQGLCLADVVVLL